MLDVRRKVEDGCGVVVEVVVDLEKLLDRVNLDILMERLARRIDDKAVQWLTYRCLVARIMDCSVVVERSGELAAPLPVWRGVRLPGRDPSSCVWFDKRLGLGERHA